jgi:hypothetical protein
MAPDSDALLRGRGAGGDGRACAHVACVRVAGVHAPRMDGAASGGRVVSAHVASGGPCGGPSACAGDRGVARDLSTGVNVDGRHHVQVPQI